MFCTNCGKRLDYKGRCPQCDHEKGILSKVPGFRTNKLWKKIVSVIIHIPIIIFIFVGVTLNMEYCVIGTDRIFQVIENLAFLIVIVFIPYTMVPDVFNISKRVPLFKKWIWRFVFLPMGLFLGILIYGIAIIPIVEANYSAEYNLAMEKQDRKKQVEEQKRAEKQENKISLRKRY